MPPGPRPPMPEDSTYNAYGSPHMLGKFTGYRPIGGGISRQMPYVPFGQPPPSRGQPLPFPGKPSIRPGPTQGAKKPAVTMGAVSRRMNNRTRMM